MVSTGCLRGNGAVMPGSLLLPSMVWLLSHGAHFGGSPLPSRLSRSPRHQALKGRGEVPRGQEPPGEAADERLRAEGGHLDGGSGR